MGLYDGWNADELDVLSLVLNCVRNTQLEDLHAGIFPSSKTGDYSDVKVVSPYGEIAWNDLSRISDEEMKSLMIEIVDRVFTYLSGEKLVLFPPDTRWNHPKLFPELLAANLMTRLHGLKSGDQDT
ncbi:hypothetical protein CcrC1_gp059c [Caulobacter phage C1]|nr:hypothetical protein CcrC1_gp059c [Caulobacter phage C1]UTU08286.1 hypothetical protein CcrC2_gp058c [Caulobacter phage C2]UTU08809.1 hypothetical protein CcrJ4_gp058c [Caulobacter phage J4]UTU09361.1 hypothetical protein CcrBL47_gp075c [Caulobacter phage BL47]UTU09921.1 hypothetical protein CcrRB23_gp059c [Caulobacter phage RB23]WGN96946.1 hypothetical protein [Bertelyvirus sp.]